jgi:hypothetical protein
MEPPPFGIGKLAKFEQRGILVEIEKAAEFVR